MTPAICYRFFKMMVPVFSKNNPSTSLSNATKVRCLITTVSSKKNNFSKYLYIGCLNYSNKNKQLFGLDKKAEIIKDAIHHRKEILKDTEANLRQKSKHFIRDFKHQREVTEQKIRQKKDDLVKEILETKAKVKERIGEVVEKENVFTIPNILCYTRIALSPVLSYFILTENYGIALGVLTFAGVTDLLDGWIARTWKSQSSKLGSFLDPMADKVLIAPLFVTLTIQNLIPLVLTLLIVARDAAIVSAVMVIRYRSLSEPKTLSRYFDMSHATAQLSPTMVSKVNTALQLLLVATTLSSPVFGFVDHPAVQALCAVTAASTVASAISYVVARDTYKMFRKK